MCIYMTTPIIYKQTHTHTHTHTSPGMVTSNEPGYYADGRFGIRIESLVVCHEVETKHRFADVKYVYLHTHIHTHNTHTHL